MKYLVLTVVLFFLGCTSTSDVNAPEQFGLDDLNQAEKDMKAHFTAVDKVWRETFKRAKFRYHSPKFYATDGRVYTPCGYNYPQSPFYCSTSDAFYISALFADTMSQRGANGDKAIGFVVAHEFAHHIQHKLGILRRKQWQSKTLGNRATRINETAADCMAAYSIYYAQSKGYLSYSYADVSELINAAASVGCTHADCSHGSPEDRTKAIIMGYQDDGLQQCSSIYGS